MFLQCQGTAAENGRNTVSTRIFAIAMMLSELLPGIKILKSVQSTLSHLISTSVPHATFTQFLVEHGLFQYNS